jgi:glutamine amidotransferase
MVASIGKRVNCMCRALLYLGQPVLLDDLLFKPESSLVNQSYMPQMLHMLNLAGFGVMAWDSTSHSPEKAYRYAATALPVFDRNLKRLASKVTAECVLAHVRGVAYSTSANISEQNTHPFNYDGYAVSLAHNGDLYRIGEMKPKLLEYIKPEIARNISGSTDSEWIYALLLSQFDDPAVRPDGQSMIRAVETTLSIIRDVRKACGIAISSSVNLFISNGVEVIGVRYCFDFGCYRTGAPSEVHEANLSYLSMWYTAGREFGFHEGEWKMIGGETSADSLIISSEPLTRDTAPWLEVPEYSLVHGHTLDGRPTISVHPIPA